MLSLSPTFGFEVPPGLAASDRISAVEGYRVAVLPADRVMVWDSGVVKLSANGTTWPVIAYGGKAPLQAEADFAVAVQYLHREQLSEPLTAAFSTRLGDSSELFMRKAKWLVSPAATGAEKAPQHVLLLGYLRGLDRASEPRKLYDNRKQPDSLRRRICAHPKCRP